MTDELVVRSFELRTDAGASQTVATHERSDGNAGEPVVAGQIQLAAGDDMVAEKPLGVLFWLALAWVAVVALLAIFANSLSLPHPNQQNHAAINGFPGIHHLLGTDDLGRDLLSRLIFGARVSLVVGFASVAFGLVIGGTLGLISGCKGGRLDIALNAGSFVILAFPVMVAVIAIVAFWGQTLSKITIVMGVGTIPIMFRVVRASSVSCVHRDFVMAARTMGATDTRIVLKEILPNVVPAAAAFGLITVAGVIVLEGSLAFLGLSVALPSPSWGNLISEGTANGNLSSNPFILMWPSLTMFMLLLSIHLLGDRLRQRFDSRESQL